MGKKELEELIFILAFKGKQDIFTIKRMKVGEAIRYGEGVLAYYNEIKEAMEKTGKSAKSTGSSLKSKFGKGKK